MRLTPDHHINRLDSSREFQQVTPIVRLMQGRPPLCARHAERRHVAGSTAGEECGAGSGIEAIDRHPPLEWRCAGATPKTVHFPVDICCTAGAARHVGHAEARSNSIWQAWPSAVRLDPLSSRATCPQPSAPPLDLWTVVGHVQVPLQEPSYPTQNQSMWNRLRHGPRHNDYPKLEGFSVAPSGVRAHWTC